MLLTLNTGPEHITEIHSGSSVFRELDSWLKERSATTDSIFILTDTNTRTHCIDLLLSGVPSLKSAVLLEIPAGEKTKSIRTASELWKNLSANGASRRSLLVNLGGGVVTDIGGFVASTFNRGIPFIHIPTTLLGMVDAAIGGKNGINLGNVKNQVGTFQHPDAIFIHTPFLETQDLYGLQVGFAEIIKIALVADPVLWKKLATGKLSDFLAKGTKGAVLDDLVFSAAAAKGEITVKDFREKNLREILNFGHTIGHAFESISMRGRKKPLAHGHAVALGMICETWLSVQKSGLTAPDMDSIVELILDLYEFYPLSGRQAESMLKFIGYDKKRRNSGIRFSLLNSPGHAVTGITCEPDEISASLDFYRSLEKGGR